MEDNPLHPLKPSWTVYAPHFGKYCLHPLKWRAAEGQDTIHTPLHVLCFSKNLSPRPSKLPASSWGTPRCPWAAVLQGGRRQAIIFCCTSWKVGLSLKHQENIKVLRAHGLRIENACFSSSSCRAAGGGWGGRWVCVVGEHVEEGAVAEEDWGVFWTSLNDSALFLEGSNVPGVGLGKFLS